MKGGTWHVIYEADIRRYIAIWVRDEAEVPASRETYLDGGYLHQFDAEALAEDANHLTHFADGTVSEDAIDSLQRIVEALR